MCTGGRASTASMAISRQPEAITAPVSRSMARGVPYAGSENARVGAPSSFMVIDPAPAATSGRNSLSHRAPPPGAAAITPVKISAAATGVPNNAPTVAAAAMAMISSVADLGPQTRHERDRQSDVDGDDGVLRPQAHPTRQAQDDGEGQTRQHADGQRWRRQIGGGGVLSAVTGQLPDHQSDGRAGQRQHQEDPPAGTVRHPQRRRCEIPECVLEQPGDLVEGREDQRRQHPDDHRGDRQHQQLPRRGSRRRRRRDLTHAAILVILCFRSRHRRSTSGHTGRPGVNPLGAPRGRDGPGPLRMRQSGSHTHPAQAV